MNFRFALLDKYVSQYFVQAFFSKFLIVANMRNHGYEIEVLKLTLLLSV